MTKFKSNILIVEDEERIRRLLRMYLEKEDFIITESENGEDALNKALFEDFDLIILDLMIPVIDGLNFCQRLRELKTTPIIILTASGEETTRVKGFEVGADDYVVKPFSPREVILRVKAILRRSSETTYLLKEENHNNVIFPNILIEHDAHRVSANGKIISLTPKEYELLHFLAMSPDKVFSREDLLKEVWNYDFFGDMRTVDTHIKRLREKLNQVSPDASSMIVTVWGVGYKLEGI